ncbi:FadR/GntR family transcriptional regulator [Phytoactinopolyspora halotolerans]|uniref:FadR family transcriptional regulator n=1 Tax=Phytoactinopolyspora halotolerans TaxID=1981512 RepID=A0A6L9S450_9ACTN|nr:FadR/GntR family transcriptional regulator [Phytoactinopolyspora halotolerans]NED99905.1 FadR family transcriptional regulator [Phytoactinopolyspora halotolerans]
MVQPDAAAFRAVERSKVYTSVVDQILASIRSGRFPPGSSLPAERVLAGQLHVSRGSLREAIRVLEHAGVLDVRTGSGTYVTEHSGSSATMLRAQAAVIGEHSPLDLIVARAAIEPVCAEHAATSRHPSDLEAIEETVEEQARLTAAREDAAEPDRAFHLAVAEASHNSVLLAQQRMLLDLTQEQMWSELKHRSRSREHAAEQYLDHHRLVLRAIRQGDARRAHQMMAMHMSAIETALIAEVEAADPSHDHEQ